MAELDTSNDDYVIKRSVDWRWSGAPVLIFGLDPLVLLLLPFVFISGLSKMSFFISALIIVFFVFIRLKTPHGRLLPYLAQLKVKYIQGLTWK